MTEAQRNEITPLVRTVDEIMKGGTAGTFGVTVDKNLIATLTPDPAPVTLTWKNDFLKATNNLIYVPFVVSIEPGKIGSAVSAYLRVAPKGTRTLHMTNYLSIREGMTLEQVNSVLGKGTEGASGGGAVIHTWTNPGGGNMSVTFNENIVSSKAQSGLPELSFEDMYFTELRAPAPGQPAKLMRAFAVPGGDYDVYVALRERPAGGGGKNNASTPTRVVVLKQELTVPNFWNNEFTISSVILADKVEPLTGQLSPEQQRERPYVLGGTEIVPATDNKFKKTEELGIIFQVYNYQLGSDSKPDVQAEYLFYQKDAGGTEKLFNKTEPQKFNAQTVQPDFSVEKGHQIVGGQMIPLATFPEGDFRLEIKVTDNRTSKTLKREVLFSVVPSS
jgi:hypothetical protein